MPVSGQGGLGPRTGSGKAPAKKPKRTSGFKLDEPITIGVCAMEKKARRREAATRSRHRASRALPLPQTSSKPMQAVLSRLTGFAPGEFKVRAPVAARRGGGCSEACSR